jgi:hypothetical protein
MSITDKVKKAFESELGQQCDTLWSTSDGRIFIRFEEAVCNTQGELDKNVPLDDKAILRWDRPIDNDTLTDKQCRDILDYAIEVISLDHPEFQEEHSTGWDFMDGLKALRRKYDAPDNLGDSSEYNQ